MTTPHLAAPGALADHIRTAAIRAAVAPYRRPAFGLPMDGGEGGAAADGGGAGAGTATATTGGDTGQAPAQPTGGQQQDDGTGGSPLFGSTPAPGQAGQQQAGQQQAGDPGRRPWEEPGQGYDRSSTRPPGERSLDEFPAEIRDYVKQLRTEAGDNRVKAKTAEETAATKQREWLDGIAKVFGLIEDTDDKPADPATRAEQLTQQLAAAQTEQQTALDAHQEAQRELAIWKAAYDHDGDPKRLTDSRTFMKAVGGLDPGAADFSSKISAAIAEAVEADDYFRAVQPGPEPAPPPAPSGGDFAGGPSGGTQAGPQTVDDFREELRQRRSRT